jgi:hypothetical protein
MVFQNLVCNVAVYANYSLLSFGAMEVRILLENLGFGSVRNWTASLLSPDLTLPPSILTSYGPLCLEAISLLLVRLDCVFSGSLVSLSLFFKDLVQQSEFRP